MKKLLFFTLIFCNCALAGICQQVQKLALVIGNAKYSGMKPLDNPENDAKDMKSALENLGFNVELVLNGSRTQMDKSLRDFQGKLASSKNSYGFFFYAGHGAQVDGRNYLLPVQMDSINDAIDLRDRALSLNQVLDRLDEAGNSLNIIILDACRDNPFGRLRGGARGLVPVSRPPKGSIIMYATGPNSVAEDGNGRNSPFTTHLLTNLKTIGLSVQDILNRTGRAVRNETGGKQHPQIYDQFFEGDITYLGTKPTTNTKPTNNTEQKTITAKTEPSTANSNNVLTSSNPIATERASDFETRLLKESV